MGCPSNMTGVLIRRRADMDIEKKSQGHGARAGCQPRREASGGAEPPPYSLRNRDSTFLLFKTLESVVS